RRRRGPQQRVNIYVWDAPVEALARHLLLLQVAHDTDLPVRQRANVLLEIFGNTQVQERTSRYIAKKGEELIQLVCYGKGAQAELVDLKLLKFKDKDLLEETFKSWGHDVAYDIIKLRDERLRQYFGQRYDSRKHVVDWDYNGRIKEVASIVHIKQYRGWRTEGLAFEFGDQVYDHPNRSLGSYAEELLRLPSLLSNSPHSSCHQGFWLDIRVGPFITWGVTCETANKHAEGLFQILNKGTGTEQQRHNTAEVAVFSVVSCLSEVSEHFERKAL
ncbi:unnamed protein product, partial [Chrysoparadoxa australica]